MFHLCDTVNQLQNKFLIRHRFHARFELNTTMAYDNVITRMNSHKIHELSLMDHTPGQGQYRDLDVFKKVIQQQYGLISEQEKEAIINTCRNKPILDPKKINTLIETAYQNHIPLAYHDVSTIEQVDWMLSNHFSICEFPLNKEVAKYATTNGLYCAVGSPNVILGHSYYNNASATDLLINGAANILCSDYFSPTLLLAILRLYKSYNIEFSNAVRFASLFPARALGIDQLYGSIAKDKKADLIIVDITAQYSHVLKTIVNGKEKSSLPL